MSIMAARSRLEEEHEGLDCLKLFTWISIKYRIDNSEVNADKSYRRTHGLITCNKIILLINNIHAFKFHNIA